MIVLSPAVSFPAVDPIAPRPLPTSFAGLHLGVLDNQKPNARALLEGVVGGLRPRGISGSLWARKPPNLPTSEAELNRLLAPEIGLVIVASADCGSCTSWCVHDAIALERRGTATLLLVTAAFVSLARAEAIAYGLPGLRLVEVPHPLGGAEPLEVTRYSGIAVEEIARLIG